jgi:hypothetical protein
MSSAEYSTHSSKSLKSKFGLEFLTNLFTSNQSIVVLTISSDSSSFLTADTLDDFLSALKIASISFILSAKNVLTFLSHSSIHFDRVVAGSLITLFIHHNSEFIFLVRVESSFISQFTNPHSFGFSHSVNHNKSFMSLTGIVADVLFYMTVNTYATTNPYAYTL